MSCKQSGKYKSTSKNGSHSSKKRKGKKGAKSYNEQKEDDSNNDSPASSNKSGTTTPTTSTLKPIGWYGKGRKSGNRSKHKNKSFKDSNFKI